MCLVLSAEAQNNVVVIPLGDGPYADMYWVTVGLDGSTVSKTEGVVATSATGITGSYKIEFDVDDVSECFATGSVANTQSTGVLRGSVGISMDFEDPKGLFVKVIDGAGNDLNSAFTIQLACPQNVIIPG